MRVLVAYPASFVGRHLVAGLAERHEVLAPDLDLRDGAATRRVFADLRPEAVVLDTPFAGGIALNVERPADLLVANLEAQLHAFREALRHRARVVFLGSSCMYPRSDSGALAESHLGGGPLEPTNAAYATAKLAGWQLARAHRRQHDLPAVTLVPANLYGPHDDFDPASGHVVAALLRRFHEAKEDGRPEVTLWGSGRPVRDFLYAADLASLVARCLEEEPPWEELNAATGTGVSIRELAAEVARVVGFEGRIATSPEKPDGMPRKVLDPSRAAGLGWRAATPLAEGLRRTYAWFVAHLSSTAGRRWRDE